MHTKIATSIFALSLGIFASADARAADVYNQGGSTKDMPGDHSAPRDGNHSGFYIKGDLGIANGDRDVSRNISGEAGKTKFDRKGPDREEGENCDGDTPSVACSDNTLEDVGYNDPAFVGALAGINSSDSFDGMVFGGEISYLWHRPNSRVGLELAIGATFYNESKTRHGFEGEFDGTFRAIEDGIPVGDPIDFTTDVAGFTDVERDLDIDFILRGHYFLAHNWSLYAGGGLSLAKATISGAATGNGPDGPVEHSFKESVWAPGGVLNAGTQYWLTDRITLGVDYTYKMHKFDTTKNSLFGEGEECDPYLDVNDKASSKENVHAVKARLGVKLGGGLPSLD